MTVLALVSEKGGAGKSSISIHLAAEWHRRGKRVLLVDCDPQGSTTAWAAKAADRELETPPVVAVGDGLHKQVAQMASDYDIVVLDTPGHQSRRVASALAVADLALVPVQPGATDVWAVSRTIEGLEAANDIREANGIELLRGALLLNAVQRTALTKQARKTLKATGLPVLTAVLGRRVAFGEAIAMGQGVTDYASGSSAALEMRNLADELSEILGLEEEKHVEAV